MRSVLFLTTAALASAACADSRRGAAGQAGAAADSVSASSIGPATAAAAQTVPGAGGVFSPEIQKLRTDPNAPIRALYVNRFAAQSTRKMKKLIDVADSQLFEFIEAENPHLPGLGGECRFSAEGIGDFCHHVSGKDFTNRLNL